MELPRNANKAIRDSYQLDALTDDILKPHISSKADEGTGCYDPGQPTRSDIFSGALMTWGTSVESTAWGGSSVTRRFAR